jgi:hypothetical protein
MNGGVLIAIGLTGGALMAGCGGSTDSASRAAPGNAALPEVSFSVTPDKAAPGANVQLVVTPESKAIVRPTYSELQVRRSGDWRSIYTLDARPWQGTPFSRWSVDQYLPDTALADGAREVIRIPPVDAAGVYRIRKVLEVRARSGQLTRVAVTAPLTIRSPRA